MKMGCILFSTGDAGVHDRLVEAFVAVDMLEDFIEPKYLGGKSGTKFIVYDPESRLLTEVYRNSDNDYVSIYTYPEQCNVAFGSGATFAMGAMNFGANASEAVKAAAISDTLTGGVIHSFDGEDYIASDGVEREFQT